ncbi:MAG TPA: methyltransferase domain-containing protein [Vicinamibacterales bacterium]|jgi:ubiquinone/menaquinone biosynthesis C-methylase UbiE
MKALAALVLACVVTAPLAAQQRSRLFPPGDLGLLEGPDRELWQQPDRIMDALLIGDGSSVADVGAGGGWFTVRLARRVGPNGLVFAEDVQRPMIEAIQQRVRLEGLRNVRTVLGTSEDPGLPSASLDAVLIVDSYYEFERPIRLLANLAKTLKPTGRIGIINFKRDGGGPGPIMENRVDPKQVVADARDAGLVLQKQETFLRYQYLLIFGPAPK